MQLLPLQSPQKPDKPETSPRQTQDQTETNPAHSPSSPLAQKRPAEKASSPTSVVSPNIAWVITWAVTGASSIPSR